MAASPFDTDASVVAACRRCLASG